MAHATLPRSRPDTGIGGWLATMTPAALAVLRVGAALLFMQHGAQKLFGAFGGLGPSHGTAPLMSLMGVAGVLEFVGGSALVLGLGIRIVAPLLAIEMVVAFFKVHLPRGGVPLQNGGELALLYAVVFIALSVLGGGAWSVDDYLFKATDRGPSLRG
jgi:putative oxidoreductase